MREPVWSSGQALFLCAGARRWRVLRAGVINCLMIPLTYVKSFISQICWRLACRRRLFRDKRIIRTCRLRPSMPTPGLRQHITNCVTSTRKNKARRLTYRLMTCLCGLLFWTSPLRGLFFGRSPCRDSVVSFGIVFCRLKCYSYVCGACH